MATHRKVLGRDLDENLGAGDVVDRVVQLVEHLPNLAEDRFLDFLGRGAQDQVDAQGAEELMLRVSHRVGRLDKACEEHGLGVKKKYIKVSDSKKNIFLFALRLHWQRRIPEGTKSRSSRGRSTSCSAVCTCPRLSEVRPWETGKQHTGGSSRLQV